MLAADVENTATSLSPLLVNIIKKRIIKTEASCMLYTHGEALLFWLADWLTLIKLLKPDQLQLLIEEFAPTITTFGTQLQKAEEDTPIDSLAQVKKLPTCKVGFLDRRIACIDGRDTFLDLETGDTFPAVDRLPLETIGYNLTTLFLRYQNQMRVRSVNKPPTQPKARRIFNGQQ